MYGVFYMQATADRKTAFTNNGVVAKQVSEGNAAHLTSRSWPRWGRSQVASSQRTTPKENMSTLSEQRPPISSSGAAHANVPATSSSLLTYP